MFYVVPDRDVIADQRIVEGWDVRVPGYPGAAAGRPQGFGIAK